MKNVMKNLGQSYAKVRPYKKI